MTTPDDTQPGPSRRRPARFLDRYEVLPAPAAGQTAGYVGVLCRRPHEDGDGTLMFTATIRDLGLGDEPLWDGADFTADQAGLTLADLVDQAVAHETAEHAEAEDTEGSLATGYERIAAYVFDALASRREPLPEWRVQVEDVAGELDRIVQGGFHPDATARARSAMFLLAGLWLSVDEVDDLYLDGRAS